MHIDEWRIVQYLYKTTDDNLIEWCKKVSSPLLGYQHEMDVYGEPENHDGYVNFLRALKHRWYEIGLTVEELEKLP
jgi:hypothetical protein